MTVARAAVHRLLSGLSGGTLTVVDGVSSERYGDHRGDLDVKVSVADPRAYGAVLRSGGSGLGAAYAAGWWSTDDLPGLIRLAVRNMTGLDRLRNTLYRATAPVLDPVRRLRRPSDRRDRRNVQAHYDLSNELFALFLDPSMTYSCAWFERPSVSLEAAQRAKLDRLCDKLALAPGDRLVEIGSGWGSMAAHAASTRGCAVTTTTVSPAQRSVAEQRVTAAGLDGQVTVLGDDYRNLGGRYDKLVSVEMIEAVDWRDHDTFFGACSRLLRPGGLMALQAIVVADDRYERAKVTKDFIKRYIFPGGCLPSLGSIRASVDRATPLQILDVEDLGPHYVETLARWRANLLARREELAELGFDDYFCRLWEFYLAYCEGAFAEQHVSVVQLVLAKP